MVNSNEVVNSVLGKFPLPTDVFMPEDNFWLTLYLGGGLASYTEVRPKLQTCGWQNLDELKDFSGFAYPKTEIENSPESVRIALLDAISICDGTGMEIVIIDADTALKPSGSNFFNLYKS